jgi:hypothetical protein
MTANIVPITDDVPAVRDESLNQPPTGGRRRTRNLVTAAVTTTARTSAATQMRTANYSRRVPGSAGSLDGNPALHCQR